MTKEVAGLASMLSTRCFRARLRTLTVVGRLLLHCAFYRTLISPVFVTRISMASTALKRHFPIGKKAVYLSVFP